MTTTENAGADHVFEITVTQASSVDPSTYQYRATPVTNAPVTGIGGSRFGAMLISVNTAPYDGITVGASLPATFVIRECRDNLEQFEDCQNEKALSFSGTGVLTNDASTGKNNMSGTWVCAENCPAASGTFSAVEK